MRLLSHTHTHTHTHTLSLQMCGPLRAHTLNLQMCGPLRAKKTLLRVVVVIIDVSPPSPPHINVAWLLARSRCEKNAPFRQGSDGQALPTLKWGGEGGGRSRASVCKGALFSLGTGRECRVCARSSSPDLCFSVLACVGAAAQS